MVRLYTCNIMKGGAMISECLLLLQEWCPGEKKGEFINRVTERNLIGKASRKRVRDIINRIFFRRFFKEEEITAINLKSLLSLGYDEDLVKLFYYHTALADDLLYDFASQWLYSLYFDGRYKLDTSDGVAYIEQLGNKITPQWSENIKTKTARGLLATCRDFGLLQGAAKKSFAPIHIPVIAFLYVAYHLKKNVPSAGRLLTHPDWRLFLLTNDQVEQLFLEAHQNGHLGYYSAGGITRIEWKYDCFTEFLGAFAAGADKVP